MSGLGAHTDYDNAHKTAGDLATLHKIDVAVRKCREFGKTVYRVSFASKNDSDYALAEIVRPGEPTWSRGVSRAPSPARTEGGQA